MLTLADIFSVSMCYYISRIPSNEPIYSAKHEQFIFFSLFFVLPHGLMVKTSASHDGCTVPNPVAGVPRPDHLAMQRTLIKQKQFIFHLQNVST